MKDNLIKKAYISAFDIEDKYLKDLIVINTKCLVDDNIQRRVYIDNKRLRDELIYYKFYGERPNYNNILNLLLPVIISNTNIKKSEDEVLQLIPQTVKPRGLEVVPDRAVPAVFQRGRGSGPSRSGRGAHRWPRICRAPPADRTG